jgi:hypothetical protein
MAKLKRTGTGTKKVEAPASKRGLVPCAIIILLGMLFMGLLFFYSIQSGVK